VSTAIRSDFDIDKFLKGKVFDKYNRCAIVPLATKKDFKTFFDHKWLKYMKSINLEFDTAVVFYRVPHCLSPGTHIDATDDGRVGIYAINFVADPNDKSFMTWHKMPKKNDSLIAKPNQVGNHYIGYPHGKLKEVARHSIGRNMVMVRTGVPHDIDMTNCRTYRLSVSIRFRGDRRPDITDWKSAEKHFAYLFQDNE
jgi:hypothetical protein